MSKRRTKASATNAIQKLDALIQAGDWEAASEPALLLFKQYPTTPGVMERSMHVLRQVEQWQLLVDLLIEARNRYQLWPYGSDLLIGQSLVELEQWDQAIPYLQLALAQPEHAPWAHHFFGKALRHTGRIEEALTHQRQAEAMLPDFPWAPFEAAQLLIELQQMRLAVLELQEARRRHGSPNPVMEEQWVQLQHLVLLSKVEQHQEQGQISEAFAVLRRAMAQAPDDPALNAKVCELLALPQRAVDGSVVEKEIDVTALDVELGKIELMLDQLEEQLTRDEEISSIKASPEEEISYR